MVADWRAMISDVLGCLKLPGEGVFKAGDEGFGLETGVNPRSFVLWTTAFELEL